MTFRTIIAITISVCLFASCQNRNEDKTDDDNSGNRVNLNVNRDQSDRQSDTTRQAAPQPPADPDPVVEIDEQPPVRDYFLSGRTSLLALSYAESVEASGFSLGDLYFETTATSEDKALVDICINFFNGLMISDFRSNLIDSKRQLELKDYWLYFIKDKISFSDIMFGKPVNVGNERQIMFLLRPDNQEGHVYLRKHGNTWILTGLELDLREAPEETSMEKWAPSVKPSPFGY